MINGWIKMKSMDAIKKINSNILDGWINNYGYVIKKINRLVIKHRFMLIAPSCEDSLVLITKECR